MPSVLKMVHRGLQQVSNMRVSQADLMDFEVDDSGDTYVVNLENKACSYNRWTLMGIPCWHALAYIQLRRLVIENFIHQAYHVETYTKAYAPTFKEMPEAREDKERKNVKRAKVQNKCSNCGGLGHYKNNCPTPPIDKLEGQPGRPKKLAATGQAVAGQPEAGQAAGTTSSQQLSQSAEASQHFISLSTPQHGTQ
uniref:CCHC-type domain-containing protein n=1 Tax=Chenopodium quinoa TaxID=63459 RepID=A0A803L207_CHEQI